MKKVRLLFAVPLMLLFVAVTDAQSLSPSSGCGANSKAQLAALPSFMAPEPVNASVATCSVTCPGGSILSCTVSGCSAQDCSGPGTYSYIVCNGHTTSCSSPCGGGAVCTPGTERSVPGGCCTPNKGKWWWQVCNSSGQWEETGNWFCYGACQPIDPL